MLPGQQVTWTYQNYNWRKRHKAHRPVSMIARVLSVGPNTAHIEYRRNDGRIARRYIKLARIND